MSAYSPAQVSQWADYVGLPTKYRPEARPNRDLAMLKSAFVHQLGRVPYENLTLHYNAARIVDLEPQALFKKIVSNDRGRGGYCLEDSIFFWHMLRGLGFNAYMAGVRIKLRKDAVPYGDFAGFRHIVNIVTLEDGTRWHIDVGFGGDGPSQPLKMEDGYTIRNLGTQDVRLTHDFIPEQTSRLESQKHWIYSYRNGPDKPWNAYYAFTDAEFFPIDFDLINYVVSQDVQSFQRLSLLCLKFILDREQERISGKVMVIDNQVKANYGGRTETLKVLHTEQQRIEALQEYCGVTLTEEEIAGMRGHITEICPKIVNGA